MTDHHTPHPTVQRFEEALGRHIGQQRCGHCRQAFGNEPRRLSVGKGYHPACHAVMKLRAEAVAKNEERRLKNNSGLFYG